MLASAKFMVKNKIRKSLLDQGQLLSDNFLLKTSSKIQKSAVKEIDIESSKNTLLYSPYKTEVKLNLVINEIKSYSNNIYLPKIFPNKEVFITENGIATDNDDERIEFVTTVLKDVHKFQEEHKNIIGYLYWSLLDNFEWDLGYQMNFGLVEVNKNDYSRKPHKSAYWFGNISKTNNLSN